MSYLWIVRISILALLQFVTSFALIYNGKKRISYFTEILFSILGIMYGFILVPILLQYTTLEIIKYLYTDYLFTAKEFVCYIIAYIAVKILLVVVIYILKIFSFDAIVSINKKNGIIAKIGYKMFGKKNFTSFTSIMWHRVDYGKRIKRGMPERVRKKHRATGIYFDSKGFPEFEAIETVKLSRKLYNKTREVHFYNANKILYERIKKNRLVASKFTKEEKRNFKEGLTPERYTWHHHQKKGVLQLVDRNIHESVNHRGGYSIWGKRKD